MKNIFRQVFLLYVRYKTFMILAGLLVLGAVGSSLLLRFVYHRFSAALLIEAREEATVFLFIFGVWFMMLLGIFLKRQFASYRAHLLPGYRKPHIYAAFIVFLVSVAAVIAWLTSLPVAVIALPFDVVLLIALQGIVFSLFALYLGYLSIEVFLLLIYLAITLLSMTTWDAFGLLGVGSSADLSRQLVLACLALAFLLFLRHRLLTLREEYFEYPYLLSWPPKELAKNQARVYDLFQRWDSLMDKALGRKPQATAYPAYPKERVLLFRSRHWDCFEQGSFRRLLVLFAIAIPLYVWYLKAHPEIYGFFTGVQSNFLILSVAPIMSVLCFNYKKMGYWQRDMMKPVRRKNILKERGVALLTLLAAFWTFFAFTFAVLPNMIIAPALLRTPLFWAYLFLTGCYAFAVFSWIIFLVCLSVTKVIIANFIGLALLSLFQALGVPSFSLEMLIVTGVFSLAAGAVFLKTALKRWYEKEIE
jgi:hypothetical protein